MANIFETPETRPSLTSEAHRKNVDNPVKPVMLDEVVYDDYKLLIKKFCFWEKCSLYPDEDTGYFKVFLPGSEPYGSSGKFAHQISPLIITSLLCPTPRLELP